jgi:hypothetical protein
VLEPSKVGGLTGRGRSGKTSGARSSKQGMTTKQPARIPRTRQTPSPCLSDGPPVDVRGWRRCRLLEYGFPPALAERLADERTDLHALLQLVDRGCPPELAARILSPLEERG